LGTLDVQLPERLARDVTDAALWAGKSPSQFVIDVISAAFSDGKGVA